MGKYDSFFPISTKNAVVTSQEATISVLVKIANELAESNRLKRLELSLTKLPENSEKLGDQA